MVTITDITSKPRHEVFPLSYALYCNATDMIYTEQIVQEKMVETPIPFLLALETYLEEL
jgi:hypothetical protein